MVCSEEIMLESKVEAASEIVEEESISFGRFAGDALSWDRWSSFSPNKYLEEVEKCSPPGSVAKKKAYFEAHYRKIAAAQRDDELVEEQKMETSSLRSEIPNCGFQEFSDIGFIQSHVETGSLRSKIPNRGLEVFSDIGFEQSDVVLDSRIETIGECGKNKEEEASHQTVFNSNDGVNEQNKETEPTSFLTEDENSKKSELDIKQEDGVVLVKKDWDNTAKPTSQIEPSKKFSNKKPEGVRRITEIKMPAPKKTPALKIEIPSGGKKKKASSTVIARSASKPVPSPSRAPISQSISTKKGNSRLPTSKKPLVMDDSKRAAAIPRSRHVSLGVGARLEGTTSTLTTTTTTTTRRTSIVEEMGDKEIVKRAFKAFQHSYLSKSSTDNNSITVQVSAMTMKRNVSVSAKTRGSDKEGSKKRVENASEQSRPLNPTVSSGNKTVSVKAGAPSSSYSLRSDERAEKRREFFKKLEEKSNAKEVEKTQFQAISKEEKEVEMRKLRQSLNFKAMPMPYFYRGSRPLKDHKNKEAAD